MSEAITNKNDDILVKFVNASAILLAGSLSAVKTMGFACACIKIAKNSSPIIGYISLVSLEIAYHKFSKFVMTKTKQNI